MICDEGVKQVPMIKSISRYTDMPFYFPDEAIKEAKSASFSVLWTKNASNILDKLKELDPKTWYIQYTINGYDRRLEPETSRMLEQAVYSLKEISEIYGKDHIVWRFDPIIFDTRKDSIRNVNDTLMRFESLYHRIADYCDLITVSMLDHYDHTAALMETAGYRSPTLSEVYQLSVRFEEFDSRINTCSDSVFFLPRAACIDHERIKKISGLDFEYVKDPCTRNACNCHMSTDVGKFNTCKSNCLYCYARGMPDEQL